MTIQPKDISVEKINQWITEWLNEELSQNLLGVLATVDDVHHPHTRTVAVSEISNGNVLFFTQKGSQKVQELQNNPSASMTILLPVHSRQITFEGECTPLNEDENLSFWKSYPKISKIRFTIYGPLSGQRIANNEFLDAQLNKALEQYKNEDPKMPNSYVGYRICTEKIKLYQFNSDRISDSFILTKSQERWQLSRVIP